MSQDKINKKIENILELIENENTAYHNLWDTMEVVLWDKIIAMHKKWGDFMLAT